MKKHRKCFTIIMTIVMLFSLQFTFVFADTAVTHWAKDSIATVVEKGLFNGISDKSFKPDAPMTRALFVTVLGRINGVDISAYQESKFIDVAPNSWYGGYVDWADDNGIANGTGNDKFAPDAVVTREQMAVMLTNYCKYIKKGPVGLWAIRLDYNDLDKVNSWASEGVMFSTLKSYITGYPDGSFCPQKKATRAEAAVIVARFLADQDKPVTTDAAITH